MPNIHQVNVLPPSDWQELQRLTCDLYKKRWNNEYIQEFGTIGQRQHGVDIFGYPDGKKKIEGIQCKCVKKLNAKDIEQEYDKSIAFRPQLTRFILVTTTKRNKKVQQKAAEITGAKSYPCEVVFWEDICQLFSFFPQVLKKYYSEFFLIETDYDSPGKHIKIDIDVNHYELLLSRINPKDKHYAGTLLVSDLLSKKCITYRLDDHWSRLDGIVGLTKCDAFLISKWLNSFATIESLLRIGQTVMFYKPSAKDKKEAKDNGFILMNC
jgi:hypothetical protein